MPICTRCFGARSRAPVSFVERFSDSAWCSSCFAAWLVKLDDRTTSDLHDAISLDPTDLCSAPQGEVG